MTCWPNQFVDSNETLAIQEVKGSILPDPKTFGNKLSLGKIRATTCQHRIGLYQLIISRHITELDDISLEKWNIPKMTRVLLTSHC